MTGAFATPALGAKQTLRFTAVQTTPDGPITKDKDVNANGKTIGHDVTTCKRASVKNHANCTVVIQFTAPKKGSITVKLDINFTTGTSQGIITGGTGGYAGATGTGKGRATSPNGHTVKVVLKIT